ncbi:hypothetical protein WG66_012759 [Moniliophthora roreri]|nr:hypothetical protein WG66_012759 [Moniliophthora roreri]
MVQARHLGEDSDDGAEPLNIQLISDIPRFKGRRLLELGRGLGQRIPVILSLLSAVKPVQPFSSDTRAIEIRANSQSPQLEVLLPLQD